MIKIPQLEYNGNRMLFCRLVLIKIPQFIMVNTVQEYSIGKGWVTARQSITASYDTLSYYTLTLHNSSVPALGHCVRECKLPIRRMGKLDKGKSLVGGEWVTITCNEGFRITVSSGIIGCLLDRRVLP